jgi:hypothetical protein
MPVPEPLRKLYGDTLVPRGYTAWLLDISKTELIRREKDGIYKPIFDEKGGAWYEEHVMRRLAGKRVDRQKPPPQSQVLNGYSAQHAAVVFYEMNQGKALVEIVIEKEIHPEAALAIADAYARVKGSLLLTREQLTGLGRLPIRGVWPPTCGKDLEEAMLNLIEGAKCSRCKTRPARVCGPCMTGAPTMIEETNGKATTLVR